MTDTQLLRSLRRHGIKARRCEDGRYTISGCWPASHCRLALERLLESLEGVRHVY